jgi:hypothetical protein
MQTLRDFLLRLTILAATVHSGACYTTVPKSTVEETSPYVEIAERVPVVVQGVVTYIHGGGTHEANYSPGFVLKDLFWIQLPPGKLPTHVYLPYHPETIDSTIIGRWVRVFGDCRTPGPSLSTAPDYRSQVTIQVDSLFVLE